MQTREQLLEAALEAAKNRIADLESQLQTWIGYLNFEDEKLNNALAALAATEEQRWCAMCGKMTNHGSGSCPELHPDEDTITLQRELIQFCKDTLNVYDEQDSKDVADKLTTALNGGLL